MLLVLDELKSAENNQYWEEDVYVCSLLFFVYSHLTIGLLTVINSYRL